MRREELVNRFYRAGVTPPVPNGYSLPDMVRIAEALGVSVEPDEPELPGQVAATWDAGRGEFTVRVRFAVDGCLTDGPVVLHLDRVDGYEARLLLEAFVAYNKYRLPRWAPSLHIDTTENRP